MTHDSSKRCPATPRNLCPHNPPAHPDFFFHSTPANMVLPKSKNAVGLGNSLMNDRFGKGKGSEMRRGNAIQRTGQNGETVRWI